MNENRISAGGQIRIYAGKCFRMFWSEKQWKKLISTLIIMGIIVLVKPDNMLNFLSIALGICTLVDCLFKTKIALDAKKFGIRQWWLTMGMAIITGVAGLLLAFRPSEAIEVITILLGICLLSDGILNLSVAFSLVKIVKHQQPDVIDVEYYE